MWVNKGEEGVCVGEEGKVYMWGNEGERVCVWVKRGGGCMCG